jgi:hypothetical protein
MRELAEAHDAELRQIEAETVALREELVAAQTMTRPDIVVSQDADSAEESTTLRAQIASLGSEVTTLRQALDDAQVAVREAADRAALAEKSAATAKEAEVRARQHLRVQAARVAGEFADMQRITSELEMALNQRSEVSCVGERILGAMLTRGGLQWHRAERVQLQQVTCMLDATVVNTAASASLASLVSPL